jgi:hypothetical protein
MMVTRLHGAFVTLYNGDRENLCEVYLDFEDNLMVRPLHGGQASLLSGGTLIGDGMWEWRDLALPLGWVVDESRSYGYIHVVDVAKQAARRLGVVVW